MKLNLNPDYFNINASNQLSPVLELKGIKTNNFLKIDATTKLLELTYNPYHFQSDGSGRLMNRFRSDGGLMETSGGSRVKLEDTSLTSSAAGLKLNIGNGSAKKKAQAIQSQRPKIQEDDEIPIQVKWTTELVEALKQLRQAKGITQVDLAKKMNLPANTFKDIENYSSQYNPTLYKKAFRILGGDPKSLNFPKAK